MLALMQAPDTAADTTPPDGPQCDNLAEAGVYRTTQEGFEHSLVVLARGHVCWLMPGDAGYRLLVESTAVERLRAELARYDQESVGWPPPMAIETPGGARLELLTPFAWALVVLGVFRGQWHHPEWADAGALDPAAIFGRGEWWRALTALFLHADESHLVANLFAGVFVFATVLSLFGRARGWLLLALGGVVGNLAVAALHYPGPYRSLGASTAIFAALGLLTGRAVRRVARSGGPHRWRAFFVPAGSGLAVLALYGAGVPPVDVLAHATGFVAGTLLGFAAAQTVTAGDSRRGD